MITGSLVLLSCKENNNIALDCPCPSTYTFYQNGSAFVFLPNIITPNGDNLNDKFRLSGNGILDYKIVIKDGTDTIVILDPTNPNWEEYYNSGVAINACELLSYDLEVTFNDSTQLNFQNELLTFKTSNLCPSNISSCFFEDQFSFGGNMSSSDPVINNCD